MKPKAEWAKFETEWLEEDSGDVAELYPKYGKVWKMIYRTVIIYLGLVVGLGAVITWFGGNPLAYNWFLPKILLFIVGVALLMAVANVQMQDQGQSLVSLMGGFSRPFERQIKPDSHP